MTQEIPSHNEYFTPFQVPIESLSLPERFTFPFFYEPHPLCIFAAEQLQKHLTEQTKWKHDFGINHYVDGVNIGKMFGVLLVEDNENELGFLKAFSGKLAGKNSWPGFVPPIADYLMEDGFFRKEEKLIDQLTSEIKQLEEAPEFKRIQQEFFNNTQQSLKEIRDQKSKAKYAKNERKTRRELGENKRSKEEYEALLELLREESINFHFEGKDLAKHWKKRIGKMSEKLAVLESNIRELKKKRREKSAGIQQEIFNQYRFLNRKKEVKTLTEIFLDVPPGVPSSGAGDCAAPKLLQYAFENNLKPLAMAEFWWGQSPKSEIRKHGYYYPSCKGKCHPILGHMLEGIEMDESPLQNISTTEKKLDVLYEDDQLLVINKPADFLSVPGRTNADSVYQRMKKKYPQATGPLMVHRLDRATSGLMLIAKSKEVHKELQAQFLDRTIKKSYIAMLEGTVREGEGKIQLPLRVDLEDRPRQLVCHEHGKPATTHWKVLERANNRTRIMFTPITGRTHQLRVHAAHPDGLNWPIVGDDLYGKLDTRLHLHAQSLEFNHPVLNKKMEFKAKAQF